MAWSALDIKYEHPGALDAPPAAATGAGIAQGIGRVCSDDAATNSPAQRQPVLTDKVAYAIVVVVVLLGALAHVDSRRIGNAHDIALPEIAIGLLRHCTGGDSDSDDATALNGVAQETRRADFIDELVHQLQHFQISFWNNDGLLDSIQVVGQQA